MLEKNMKLFVQLIPCYFSFCALNGCGDRYATQYDCLHCQPRPRLKQNSPPAVVCPSSKLFLLISSNMKQTQALDMFPYSLRTVYAVLSFSLLRPSLASNWSSMAAPPGYSAIQKIEFQSLMPNGANAQQRILSMLFDMRSGTS